MNSIEDIAQKYEKLLILGNRKGDNTSVFNVFFLFVKNFYTASDTEKYLSLS